MAVANGKLGTPLDEVTSTIDADRATISAEGITYRGPDAFGDPIHLDENVARSVGLPGVTVHGLGTMAVCSRAVVTTPAGGGPAGLPRLAVRFAKNVVPDSDVTVSMYDADAIAGAHACEAHSRGDLVIFNGRAEVER